MSSQKRFLGSLFALALLAGCTRGSNDGNTSIHISLPDVKNWQAKAGKVSASAYDPTQVTVLIVNVSGADMPTPAFFSWNAHNGGGTVAPSVVTLTVPQGSSRVIQVVVGAEGSSGMNLSYGSATADLSGASVDVDVTVNNLSTSTGMEGRIAGRYLTSAGIGPTGRMNVFLTPPGSTLPPILVQQSEIIGGYFDIFGMTDVGFSYKLADGTLILPENARLAVDPANPLYPTSNATSMAYVPASYRANAGPNDVPAENILLLGYFGPGANAATNSVCYDNSSGTIANAWLDAAHTQTIPFSSAPTALANIRTTAAGVLAGGSSISCGGTALTDYLQIVRDNLVNGNSVVPFRGPYVQTGSYNYLTFTDTAGSLQVNWSYAPGVFDGANPITGSQVFYMVNPTNQNYRVDDGFDCGNLAAMGFSSLAPTTGVGAITGLIPSLSTASNVEVIVCPYRLEGGSPVYFKSAADGNPNGGAYVGAPPYHLVLTATAMSPGMVVAPLEPIATNTSSNLTLQLVDGQNKAVAVGAGTSITLTSSYSLLTFDGVSTTSSSVTLDNMGKATFPFYVGGNVYQDAHMTYTYAGGITGLPTAAGMLLPVGIEVGEPSNIQISTQEAPSTIAVNGCAPVEYYLYQGSAGTIRASTANVTFIPTSPNGTFYFDAACAGSVATTVTIPAGKTIAYLYFKPSASGTDSFNMSGTPMNAVPTTITLWSSNYMTVNP